MISFPAVLVAHALLLCVSLSAATVDGTTDVLNVDMNVEDQGSRHLRNKLFRRRRKRGGARRSRGSRGSSGLLYHVEITASNRGPRDGTCQTPVWIGIHDGSFDIYDRNERASPALERLAEDGNNMPLSDTFNRASGTVRDATVGGAPLCSGDSATVKFSFKAQPERSYYFSYASMVLPSNDAFVANGDPQAFPILIARSNGDNSWNSSWRGRAHKIVRKVLITDNGRDDVLDAGTEVNDELPENTAFLDQEVPDSGMVEGGVVTDHPGFSRRGNILSDAEFRNADFECLNSEVLRITVKVY